MFICGHFEIASKRAGRIALCQKNGPIVATADIAPSIPLPRRRFAASFAKHRVPPAALRQTYPTGELHAWPLSNVRKLTPPITYHHPGGGSWVRLTKENVKQWRWVR